MRATHKAVAQLSISIFVVAYIIYRIGTKEFLAALKQMNLAVLLLAVVSLIITYALTALSYKLLMDVRDNKIPFNYFLKTTTLANALGMFTPGKLGEFLLLYFLKKEAGVEYGRSFATMLVVKITSVLFFLVMSIAGFFVFFRNEKQLLLAALLLVCAIIITGAAISSQRVRKIIRKRVLFKHEKKFKGFYKSLKELFQEKLLLTLILVGITAVKWSIAAFILKLCFASVGVSVSFFTALIVMCVGNLMVLIPLTLSGLGVKEGVMVYLFAQTGITAPILGATLLFIRAVGYTACGLWVMTNSKRLLELKKVKIEV